MAQLVGYARHRSAGLTDLAAARERKGGKKKREGEREEERKKREGERKGGR